MFKIGDFSRLSKVTVKTLRFYDEAGLLKAGQVDDFTGYRYYQADQMSRLNRILALKDLGFSLDQVRSILDEEVSPEQLRGMLRLRQAELHSQIEADQERLARVETRLRQIEEEKSMSKYDPILKTTTPVKAIALRRIIPSYHSVGDLMTELWNHLQKHGGRLAGPGIAIYYDPEYKERDVDVEVAFPIAGAIPESGEIKIKELPEVQVVSIIHQGPYPTLNEAYGYILKWIGESPYQISGPNREIYLEHVDSSSGKEGRCVTEIQIPVVKK